MAIEIFTHAFCDIVGCGSDHRFLENIPQALNIGTVLWKSKWFFKQENDGTYSAYCPACVEKYWPQHRNREDIVFQVSEELNRQDSQKEGNQKKMVIIENWSLIDYQKQSETIVPDLSQVLLQGNIYNHPDSKFKDGDFVRTGEICDIREEKGYKIIITDEKSGFKEYAIFSASVAPAYEALFPNAYERLTYRK